MNNHQFRKLSRSVSRGLVEIEKDGVSCCGLPILQSHILIELGENPNLSLNEVAKKLSSEKASISRAVQSLVEKGLVDRQTETHDRRSVTLSLTTKGLDNFNDINKEMNDYAEQILSHFTTEETDSLFYYLNKLDETIQLVNNKQCNKDECQ
ncbi:MarR family winged helix-turn-helix transcriptional regulator [Macrococcoides canis]|uniref:MarR family winged helix-turn-helix transcriptional regulator n=1 Tax=Macrococcoides canis TaxID=1855823 RepID=UPI0022B906B4|nr:MarR family transcriptional regulator [Macrococcus canis]WBF53206.1 MarR family transcriptional regulator [Macrococcus canis]